MALPQPDFARASACLTNAAEELALCANMPAVIQDQGIIDAINALAGKIQKNHQQLQQQLQQMQQQIAGLHDRLDSLAMEVRARDANNLARLTNNELTRKADQSLEPLCSITTGNTIPGFPSTPDGVMRLTDLGANEILRHLGHDMGQALIATKRQRIKSLCGLVAL